MRSSITATSIYNIATVQRASVHADLDLKPFWLQNMVGQRSTFVAYILKLCVEYRYRSSFDLSVLQHRHMVHVH